MARMPLNQPANCEECPLQKWIDCRVMAIQDGIVVLDRSAASAETPESFLEMETLKRDHQRKIENLYEQGGAALETCYGPWVHRLFGLIGKKVVECTSPLVHGRPSSEWRADL